MLDATVAEAAKNRLLLRGGGGMDVCCFAILSMGYGHVRIGITSPCPPIDMVDECVDCQISERIVILGFTRN